MSLIELDDEGKRQQIELILTCGQEEILSLLSEECGELIQSAQKVRRCMAGVYTSMNMEEAISSLNEEVADVLLLIDCINRSGLIDMEEVQNTAIAKNIRWWSRTYG